MQGAIEMGADVQRRVDPLRDDADGLQILRIIHFVAGVADRAGRMRVHDVRHVDNFHGLLRSSNPTIVTRICVNWRRLRLVNNSASLLSAQIL